MTMAAPQAVKFLVRCSNDVCLYTFPRDNITDGQDGYFRRRTVSAMQRILYLIRTGVVSNNVDVQHYGS